MIIAYVFAGIVVALLLISAFMPSRYLVEKSVIIKRRADFVMSRVGDLRYYSKWNPWQQSDPSASHTIEGIAKTPGHSYSWSGKKVGIGSLVLSAIDNRHIHFDLQFLKPWKSKAKDNWLFEPWGIDETKVTWQNAGALPWPIARIMGPLINKNLNHQFEQGLANLKKMAEEESDAR
jgi:hypothetical protein